ncbi:MAG: hypothetical protein KC483_06730 [Nitrosarchaeum sp.]|nr:hypothetical protein [Nitrosarchaeum sp.]MCA9820932.1 hypothetical protein [Nitrosarchaeum sp.]
MKGLYWLIVGLCVWFIPSIIFQIVETSGDSEKTAEQVVSEIPIELVIVQFVAALVIIIKGVITIRKERKAKKTEEKTKRKSKK